MNFSVSETESATLTSSSRITPTHLYPTFDTSARSLPVWRPVRLLRDCCCYPECNLVVVLSLSGERLTLKRKFLVPYHEALAECCAVIR